MASWLIRSTSLSRFIVASNVIRSTQWLRPLTQSAILHGNKPLPPRRKILDSEIEESFLKGTGPGGQKINKTNSAVQLKHLPSGLVVKVQGTRSRDQNRKDARRLLADKLEEIELGEESRTRIKEKMAAKKKASKRKKSLRKYRALAEERKSGEEGGKDDGGEDGVEEGEEPDNPEEDMKVAKEDVDKAQSHERDSQVAIENRNERVQ